MRTTILALLVLLLFSCGQESEKAQLQFAKQQAEFERDRLLLEKKNNILHHLNEYLPIRAHINVDVAWGGLDPGAMFIENKTGYDVQNVVIALDVIKANGQLYNTQYIEFNNLKNGDSQSKPTNAEPRGTSFRQRIIKIIGSELTNGQVISAR